MTWRLPPTSIILLCLAAPVTFGQEPAPAKSFEERLVEILKAEGIVDEAKRKELLDLVAARMRAEEGARKGDLEREMRAFSASLASAGQEKPPGQISYKKGFTFETPDGDFSLRINPKVQVRATWEERDDDATGGDSLSFAVNRLRLEFSGNAYGKQLTYKIMPELRGGSVALRDGYLNYAFQPEVEIRGGQFKVPFSRQQLTSAFRQQFVDRAFTDDLFAPGREPGAMVHGTIEDGRIEYAVGGFNGDGQNDNTNDDQTVRWAGRVAFNPLGALPSSYTEGGLDRTEDPKLGLGVSAFHNPVRGDASPDFDVDSIGFDAIFLLRGFSVQGELFLQRTDPESGSSLSDTGGYVQGGYYFADGWEVAARVAAASLDNDGLATGDTRQQREYQLVVSRFLRRHDLKLNADLTRRALDILGQADQTDYVLRVQAQLVF